ncbi:hypothetical protein PYW07_008744 [Mythimna separata]|uniref:Uncharacterized protein n=1 Tax=Mythimna separata TaxID=271217 RepID=A0AAD7YE38_MYTSE|nr:hypothetical protein PYW07_008744 [Mythimna separata]
MNSKDNYFPRLDPEAKSMPGEGMLPRKRFKDLQLEATVFEQPAYLRPPNDTPQPSGDSDQSPPEIIKWLKDSPSLSAVRNELEVPKSPHHEAQKTLSQDCKPETQVC